MTIRNYLLVIVTISIFASCKKEETTSSVNPIAAVNQLNVQYATEPLQNMDIYLPAGRSTSATKVMIMIHGGSWLGGDKADFNAFVDTLKRRQPDYAIFNINYRLSSFGIKFPTQELDTKAAIEFIYSKRAEYLISDKFVLIGASAGAHLSLLHAYKYPSPTKIKAVVDFFGPTDMNDMYNNGGPFQNSLEFIVGGTPTSIPVVYQQSSPINFITSTTACPTIIFQGDTDPLVNFATQSAPLRDKLQIAGIPNQYNLYPGKDHGTNWGNDTYFDAFNKIQSFLGIHNP